MLLAALTIVRFVLDQAVALVAMVLFALLMFTVASHRPSLQVRTPW
jgi:hypothetical protein